MSIIDRVRADAARSLETRANTILTTARSAATVQAASIATRALNSIGQIQTAAIGRVVQAFGGGNSPIGKLLGGLVSNAGQAAGGVAKAAAQRATQQLNNQIAGRIGSALPHPLAGGLQRPTAPPKSAPAGPPPTNWTPAPLWGGMSPDDYYRLFNESAMTPRAWKNLFFVSIEELRQSKESPSGAGAINLLAADVSFAPVSMPGEAIAIGSANIDNLSATERIEVRLTTFDDSFGTLKRWFLAKCDQAARLDGTFGLPADYLVVLTITHMDPANAASSRDRMRHRFLMRPSNVEIELSRRSPELEELPMSFVQFDTFMEPGQ